ncbi:ATP-dependent DNA helicase [Parashewanella spongiae]|uniref:DNA 5'-3' helicase n=1 Tax=Parashewanella spongiae TaxID=342950 RepID=A0A3A6TXI2_9GAMM|nr:ATP-dependent DNA helicase [Parashewanella spongiae]MCL1076823.1 ATP-dependent DNA helicase [Parashewanella spongiae]RJY19192.1 ATP-dependent DNA helicase [Parashewanella spongiae]
MKNLIGQVVEIFTENGSLSKGLKHFKFRSGQRDMAELVAESISKKHKLVIEAGTGIGKSYAYLIPAVLSGKKVIISTATKNLQKQLFDKDLPFTKKFLNKDIKVAILKGISNYLCHFKLEQEITETTCHSESVLDEFLRIKQWSLHTIDGDLDNLSTVSEQSIAIEKVRTNLYDCIGEHCHYYQNCFSRKAKTKAEESNILITNHHLLFSKVQSNFLSGSGVIGEAEVVIFDEAHSLPETISVMCGERISEKQIDTVITNLFDCYREHIGDSQIFEQALAKMNLSYMHWKKCFMSNYSGKVIVNSVLTHKERAVLLWEWVDNCTKFIGILRSLSGRSEEFDIRISSAVILLESLVSVLKSSDAEIVNFFDNTNNFVTFNSALLSVKGKFKQYFNEGVSCIFTSATLSYNKSLDEFSSRLGLSSCKSTIIESPFNFFAQTMLYVPRYNNEYTHKRENSTQITSNALLGICIELIKINQGRTFILCTSHNTVKHLASLLRNKIEFPLLVQGQAGKDTLLSKYKVLGNAVLIGTYSFWEGVDIKGRLLSNIIIEKLPFASPEEFFTKFRSARAAENGEDPFIETVLPQATLKLKQGIGRLIRHENDKGLITIFDERIVTHDYGKNFLLSIPEMNKTRSHSRAIEFLGK